MNKIVTNGTVLVITSKNDAHISNVADHLESAGVPWVRLNTDDFLQNISLTINPALKSGSIFIHDSQRQISIPEIGAVWYRKPQPMDLSQLDLGVAELDYVEAEVTELLQGLYAILRKVTWVNDPFTTRIAHRKMHQLQVASDLGLRVPASIITNDAHMVMEFAEKVRWSLLVKSLGAISVTDDFGEESLQYGIFSRKITRDELTIVEHTIPNMPTLFQEYVDKDYELRITCVGDKVFPCRIFSQEFDVAKEDYRFATSSLRHEMCELPRDVTDKLVAYLHAFGLNFGCFDLAFSKSGEYVFFECNPNGQWLWIENITGAQISRAIAELLKSAIYRMRTG